MFQHEFIKCLRKLSDDQKLRENLWLDIASVYSSPKRHYHNLFHLDHLTGELKPLKNLLKDWDVVVLAIAYHDVVYNIRKQDNEERSAEYAKVKLQTLLSPERLENCVRMILATKAHNKNPKEDIDYFTDADLSVLGRTESEYFIYVQQIRKEYQLYPNFIYKPGRKKLVQHFLQMSRIYKTEYFYDKYEQQARSNLQKELLHLL